jgi:hypothetical protein
MLQKLGDHIQGCLDRADECERAAKAATDAAVRLHLEQLRDQWRHAAKTYEFVASLERFLLDQHRNTLPTEIERLPKDEPER